MADAQVILRDEMGLRVPSVSRVPVSAGAQVTFTAADGADSALYFSQQTASILSPNPGSRVDLASGKSVTYSFAAANAGVYGVVTQAPGDPQPESFNFGPPANPPLLVVQPGKGAAFPVAENAPAG